MDDFGLATLPSNRRDAGKLLQLSGIGQPVSIASHGCQQSRCQRGAGTGKGLEQIPIWMRLHQSGKLYVVLFNGVVEHHDLLYQDVNQQHAAFHDGAIGSQWRGLSDQLEPLRENVMTIAVVISIELEDLFIGSRLKLSQGGITQQELARQVAKKARPRDL